MKSAIVIDNLTDYTQLVKYLANPEQAEQYFDGRHDRLLFRPYEDMPDFLAPYQADSANNITKFLDDNKEYFISKLGNPIHPFNQLGLLIALCIIQKETIDNKKIDEIAKEIKAFLCRNNINLKANLHGGPISPASPDSQGIEFFAMIFKFSVFIQMQLLTLYRDKNSTLMEYLDDTKVKYTSYGRNDEDAITDKLKSDFDKPKGFNNAEYNRSVQALYDRIIKLNLSYFKKDIVNAGQYIKEFNDISNENTKIKALARNIMIGTTIMCLFGIATGLILAKKYNKNYSVISMVSAILLPISLGLIHIKCKSKLKPNDIKIKEANSSWASKIVKSNQNIKEHVQHLMPTAAQL